MPHFTDISMCDPSFCSPITLGVVCCASRLPVKATSPSLGLIKAQFLCMCHVQRNWLWEQWAESSESFRSLVCEFMNYILAHQAKESNDVHFNFFCRSKLNVIQHSLHLSFCFHLYPSLSLFSLTHKHTRMCSQTHLLYTHRSSIKIVL